LVILSLPMMAVIFFAIISCLLDLMLPGFVALFVFLTHPLAVLKRKIVIVKGKSKFKQFSKLKTVAVTGSYGKTTTKEILSQLLSAKFKTVKTQKNNNTDVGIAKTILNKINVTTEYFVAEMGAYKLGETKECADVANPDVAIITGLDEQHFSLYGSIKAILESTAEVEEYLKADGALIINGSDDYCMRLIPMLKKKVIFYFSNPATNTQNDKSKSKKLKGANLPKDENLHVLEIKDFKKGINFTFGYQGEVFEIKSNIQARHNIDNLLAAILSMNYLGTAMKEIVELVNQTQIELPYLNSFRGINDAEFIDDGYNINPTGYEAGLKHLAKNKIQTEGKKYVLTQGFIELGAKRDEIYQKMAQATVDNADGLITTDEYLAYHIKQINTKFKVVIIDSVFILPIKLKELLTPQDIVLVEGPLPLKVIQKIKL
jgi:UDP-N-acetylmuramoyl-tripeptide--D-alanyl-D-alanine ligase